MTLRSKPTSCDGCVFHDHGTDFSQIEGTGSSGVMVVAEASGEHEAREQLPLRPFAPAGGVFERTLRRMGVDRQMLSVTNCIRCRPRNNWLEGNPHEYSALAHCRPNLDAAITERKPRAILALGGISTRQLTGLAGSALGVSHLVGYVLPLARPIKVRCTEPNESDGSHHPNCFLCGGTGYTDEMGAGPDSIPIIPNFHPAFLRRGKSSHMGVFARILQRALNIAKGKDTAWMWNVDPEADSERLAYRTHPTRQDAEEFAARVARSPESPLSYDIETSESASLDEDARDGFRSTELQLTQFSIRTPEFTGSIAIPWTAEFKPVVQQLLHLPNPKCGHNVWLFDNKVLRAAGAREGLDLTPKGIVHDTLQMFHHWQPDLPAHLQFASSFVQFPFPWKHLAGTAIEFYGCCDVDATLRLYTMLEATLKRDGIWDDTGYEVAA